ncbi:hypothetical protein [Massilia sp. NR 4-1]|uniref:hypothetical protein n=1 Tax=Massilia sp. NR 4-1 TaxID=1678028 RepID=UPI00123763C4|nr:hypothetical protein [Massilia sp. NR 4-1]
MKMNSIHIVYKILASALLAVAAVHGMASEAQDLERGLTHAMRLKRGTAGRIGDSGKAIQAYMREGLISQRPNQRADYTDYYLLRKPAKFMGHELMVIEEEYMSRYVGCCVSPGIGISVKVAGSTRNLQKFADENKCTFTDHVDLHNELGQVSIKAKLPHGDFASLSCRERDASR